MISELLELRNNFQDDYRSLMGQYQVIYLKIHKAMEFKNRTYWKNKSYTPPEALESAKMDRKANKEI